MEKKIHISEFEFYLVENVDKKRILTTSSNFFNFFFKNHSAHFRKTNQTLEVLQKDCNFLQNEREEKKVFFFYCALPVD